MIFDLPNSLKGDTICSNYMKINMQDFLWHDAFEMPVGQLDEIKLDITKDNI